MQLQKHIPQEIFNKMIENRDDRNSCIHQLSLELKYRNYEASFFAFQDENFELQFDDFGFMKSNKWNQMTPTSKQLETMTELMYEERKVQAKKKRELDAQENRPMRGVDHYDECGLKVSDFL